MSVWWEERAALLERAIGMTAAQAECGPDAALLLLKLRARALGCDLEETATAVVDGRVHFSPECPSPDPDGVPLPAETDATRRTTRVHDRA